MGLTTNLNCCRILFHEQYHLDDWKFNTWFFWGFNSLKWKNSMWSFLFEEGHFSGRTSFSRISQESAPVFLGGRHSGKSDGKMNFRFPWLPDWDAMRFQRWCVRNRWRSLQRHSGWILSTWSRYWRLHSAICGGWCGLVQLTSGLLGLESENKT